FFHILPRRPPRARRACDPSHPTRQTNLRRLHEHPLRPHHPADAHADRRGHRFQRPRLCRRRRSRPPPPFFPQRLLPILHPPIRRPEAQPPRRPVDRLRRPPLGRRHRQPSPPARVPRRLAAGAHHP